MTIKRIWHGWTVPEKAEAYRTVLLEEVLPGIAAKEIPGYQGIEVFRREHQEETEFVTIMTFDSLESVKRFQGGDYERCYVPDVARAVLERWDRTAAHYEVLEV